MEPISIAAGTLGTTFLKEGIKFLWNQAGKIIDRYHEKKKEEQEKGKADIETLARIEEPAPEFVELSPVRTIDFAVVEQKLKELRHLRKELSTYALGDEEITLQNEDMLEYVDQLQRLLSEIFTENVDVPQIKVRQFVENVKGEAEITCVEAETITKGAVDVEQRAKNVNGKVVGARIKMIG